MSDFDPRLAARALIESGGPTIPQIWLKYWALGGTADVMELDAFIHGIPLLKGLEVELLTLALKELSTE